MKIIYDEKICVRCLACVGESECGGITYNRGQIQIDETQAEDWENVIAICPVGALAMQKKSERPLLKPLLFI